ncbi:unnamed protein product [Didymodactylos carnosus]|uniref:Apple domain-containing protein n=1 Tax=Didymodactylos carnosus TaxID=1234261 RepID=A0A8S2H2D1_9BILA|nr:unnamed protein product [Didymodactylos carnosus]CAF3584756.1 unnamed protein product [Didymodactylos carnosus]
MKRLSYIYYIIATAAAFLFFINILFFRPKIPQHEREMCIILKNTSFAGGEFFTTFEKSPEDCCKTCWEHEKCVSWSLHKNMCWLKNDVTEQVNDAQMVSGRFLSRKPSSCIQSSTSLTYNISLKNDEIEHICNVTTIKKKVLFTGLAHQMDLNNAEMILKTFVQFGSVFNDWHAIIYENDIRGESSLKKISLSNNKISLISEILHVPFSKQMESKMKCGRPKLLAHLRQRLMTTIKVSLQSSVFVNYSLKFMPDYIIYFDMDLLAHDGLDIESVAKSMCKRLLVHGDSWHVLCAMGTSKRGNYQDTFALKPCEPTYYKHYHGFDMKSSYATELAPFITNSVSELVRVRSCFGGMAIYRADVLLDTKCSYNDKACMCEHVYFHSCLANEKYDGIYIDTKMILRYYPTNKKP